jgi:DNA-binding FadR family transcriptional regulator
LPHHRKVLDAVRRRQPEAARRAMQRMIADSSTPTNKTRRHVEKG